MPNQDDFGWQRDELVRSGLFVEDDRPGSRLRLAWQGSPPRAALRLWGAIVLAAAVMMVGGAAAGFFWLRRGNPLALDDLAVVGFASLFCLFAMLQAAAFLSRFAAYWESFAWDVGEMTFVAHRRGWLFWGAKTESIPLASIESISFRLGPEGRGPTAIELLITAGEDDDFRHFDADLTSLGYLKRGEAVSLLFSIGRAVKAAGYSAGENNPQRQLVQLWLKRPEAFEPDEDDDEPAADDLRPLPLPEDAAVVAAELTRREPAGEPIAAKHTFDPASLEKIIEFTRVEDWRPGQKVCIVTPRAPWGVIVFLSLLGAIAAGLAGAFPIWGVIGGFVGGVSTGRYAAAACAALFGGCLAGFLARNNLQRRELVFDWLQKQATWRIGAVAHSWPLDAIQGFVLREVRSGGQGEPTEYRHELTMIAPDRDVPVIKTEQPAKSAATSYNLLAPMAADLAASLDTSCSRTTSAANVDWSEKLWLTALQKIVLGAMGAAIAVLFLAAAVPQQIENRAAARLRERGLDISRMGSFTRNDDLIGENYWNVTVKAGQTLPGLGDEEMQLLSGMRQVGLDAEESNMTDDDLLAYRAMNWSIVNVSQTAVTDRGIAALAASGALTYLDAYDTRVSDEGMAALARSPRLRFLFLPGAKVTDAGLKHLQSVRTLKKLHLGACPVTEAGVDALRRALPGTEVIFK